MSEAIWQALAEKAIGGRSLDTLSTLTAEGLRIEPLYPRNLADRPRALRQNDGAWGVAQRVDHPVPGEANRLALLDLEGGATALTLVFEGDARGFGLPVNAAALASALEGIELDLIGLRLDAGDRAIDAAKLLAGLSTARRLTSAALTVDLGLDPIGHGARTGLSAPADSAGELRDFLETLRAAGLAGRTFLADGRPYHEAGAGDAQELAAVLATGVAYLRRLERAGQPLDDASAAIAFLLVADADTFLSIAKFRALRRLWAQVEAACGITPMPMRLHAETGWRMMTRRDPWVNVMRITAAVFAAGVGGADVITTLPFTLPLGLPEDGARRLARNTQLVLLDEAHLARVDDPAAGSGGLEALTDQLSAHAWTLFQQIEGEGGIEASLRAGLLQGRIAETRSRRARAIATMTHGITGTNTFPALGIADPAVTDVARRAEPARGALALPSLRDGEAFEALRDAAETMSVQGIRPTVFLATLGGPADYGPRATYAANFFAAAGIATMTGAADGDPAAHGPTSAVVCVCGSDAAYADRLDATVATLRSAGVARILLAGRPHTPDGTRRSAAVDGFIHSGSNGLQTLTSTLGFLHEAAVTRP
ncbi:methylmalonyl-CoA mutase family protein [Beijerinckia sp. L45]|uniref:methylmalonyl-CoA mutase family protein n=1 Tax=Beijerinckia sp. L45 TaxID=1641855 RepID=UPI00131D4D7E|nr:methylmalonyl-CoA mutase family protein [Beijerinckia sp. L45]